MEDGSELQRLVSNASPSVFLVTLPSTPFPSPGPGPTQRHSTTPSHHLPLPTLEAIVLPQLNYLTDVVLFIACTIKPSGEPLNTSYVSVLFLCLCVITMS